MKLVFTGGGTGGHVYPGLSVAEALRSQLPDAQLLYIGRAGGAEERIVPAAGLPFAGVPAAGLRGKSPVSMVRGVWLLLRGALRAYRLLGGFRPQAVFATGGYASVPVAAAAFARRIPVLVFLPDIQPGWAVRFLMRFATQMATTSDAALAYLPRKKTRVTGYPIRDAFLSTTRAAARDRLGLGDVPSNRPVLLVTGGSSGSLDINRAVARHLPQFLRLGELVHVSGPPFEPELRQLAGRLPPELQARYHLHGYLDDMPAAMAAADLAVMRAGASALGELPATGLPAVLVPGPFSDQQRNARYLAELGAAVMLPNDEVEDVYGVVQGILTAPARLASMRRAMTALARPDAAATLARLLRETAR